MFSEIRSAGRDLSSLLLPRQAFPAFQILLEVSKMWSSSVVTHSFWFTWFMEGLHKQVGKVRHQDKAITIEVLNAVQILLEREWSQAT
jgi:hypothetical protein